MRRRRAYNDCGTRFSTVEIMADEHADLVKVKSCVDYLLGNAERAKANPDGYVSNSRIGMQIKLRRKSI